MTRVLRQQHLRDAFARVLGLLHTEVALGTERRHLDRLVELAEAYLDQLDRTHLHQKLSEQLTLARQVVAQRHRLRLIQGAASNDH